MKGRSGQSLSIAGSAPSSTPNQVSTSGPLYCGLSAHPSPAGSPPFALLEVAYLAWWKPTTVTKGMKPLVSGAGTVELVSLFSIIVPYIVPRSASRVSNSNPFVHFHVGPEYLPQKCALEYFSCSTHCAPL